MNKGLQIFKYVLADTVSAILAWTCFFIYRKTLNLEPVFEFPGIVYNDPNFWYGIMFIATFWVLLYAASGTYRRIYRKSRLQEFFQTLYISTIGVITLFFILLLDDKIATHTYYYKLFIALFSFHIGFTFLFRFILSSITAYKIHNRKLGFNTILIGSNENAVNIYLELQSLKKSTGNKFVGYVNGQQTANDLLKTYLPNLGTYKDIDKIINEYKIEEVIIAIERSEHQKIAQIITELEKNNILIKAIPTLQDHLLGTVKTESVLGVPLIVIASEFLPYWQQLGKRLFDIGFSIFALILLSPVLGIIALAIKLSSDGPVFYTHKRVGLKGNEFNILKFRTMQVNAEQNGPQLSSKNDPRITKIGKILRKIRLDELPQFFNVIKGDMSVVGPRPERQFYIEQIIARAPYYRLLHNVKPGITSWGQVKYGYAENIDQMIERLRYDILYLENMSLSMDFKIIIYTILIVIQGRGK